MYKKYYSVYDYWYQIIPLCDIATRHHRWINNGEISTSYRIMEKLTMTNYVELTDNGIIFHSPGKDFEDINGMLCEIYY